MDVIEIAQISGMITMSCIQVASIIFEWFMESLIANKNKNK